MNAVKLIDEVNVAGWVAFLFYFQLVMAGDQPSAAGPVHSINFNQVDSISAPLPPSSLCRKRARRQPIHQLFSLLV